MYLRQRNLKLVALFVGSLLAGAIGSTAAAQQRRARPPVFREGQFRGIFSSDLSQLVSPDRPRIDRLQSSAAPRTAEMGEAESATESAANASKGKWRALAEPANLEDEVKRLKLHYDSVVTTPGRFKSGDFELARMDLSLLATLMAVISEYEGEIRFKDDAAIARDLFARSAIGVASGSNEAFSEAKQRKADLQDLVSGGGLNRTAPIEPTDWSITAARSPLMEYLDKVLDQTLQSGTRDADAVTENLDDLKRAAAMVAVISQVLQQDGMDDAEDVEYRKRADAMGRAALDLRTALQEQDAEAARLAVGQIGQSCSDCHDHYR